MRNLVKSTESLLLKVVASLSIILIVGIFQGCGKATSKEQLVLKDNEAVYAFDFNGVNDSDVSDWIEPHMVSLSGFNYQTISQNGLAGSDFTIMVLVRFSEKQSSEQLVENNLHILESLRKKVSFQLYVRVGEDDVCMKKFSILPLVSGDTIEGATVSGDRQTIPSE
jgi:hypothetical protein